MKFNRLETPLIDQKLKRVTEGLEPYFLKHLKTKVSRENGVVIAQYITSMRIETKKLIDLLDLFMVIITEPAIRSK